MTHQPSLPIFDFGLLRHGETVWNSEKRVQGHGDSPLTDLGRARIEQWGRFLTRCGWQAIVCSDLGRVRETVAILNRFLQLPVHEDQRLREQHWGEWEGLKVAEVYRDHTAVLDRESARGWDFRPPGGESRREVRDRVLAALDAARAMVKGEKILVVCHLGVIKCLLYSAAGCSFRPDENITFDKGCLHHLHYRQGDYHLGPLDIHLGEPQP
jgi:broad specificity phosphatase PhoE